MATICRTSGKGALGDTTIEGVVCSVDLRNRQICINGFVSKLAPPGVGMQGRSWEYHVSFNEWSRWKDFEAIDVDTSAQAMAKVGT